MYRWVTSVSISFTNCEIAPSMDAETNPLGSAFTLRWDRQGALWNSACAKMSCVCSSALPGKTCLCLCKISIPSSTSSQGQLLVPPLWASQESRSRPRQCFVCCCGSPGHAMLTLQLQQPFCLLLLINPSFLFAPSHSHRNHPRIFSTGLPLTTGYEPFSPVGNKSLD